MADAYIIDAVRTPRGIGKVGKGALAHLHPQHLASTVLKALGPNATSSTQPKLTTSFGARLHSAAHRAATWAAWQPSTPVSTSALPA